MGVSSPSLRAFLAFIAGISFASAHVLVPIYWRDHNPLRLCLVVHSTIAASGDPIPSTAYMVGGRAGLRNPALSRSCTGEGRLGFWGASCMRLLNFDRLLPLLPRRLRHHHVL
jgi:hypothetical protein